MIPTEAENQLNQPCPYCGSRTCCYVLEEVENRIENINSQVKALVEELSDLMVNNQDDDDLELLRKIAKWITEKQMNLGKATGEER